MNKVSASELKPGDRVQDPYRPAQIIRVIKIEQEERLGTVIHFSDRTTWVYKAGAYNDDPAFYRLSPAENKQASLLKHWIRIGRNAYPRYPVSKFEESWKVYAPSSATAGDRRWAGIGFRVGWRLERRCWLREHGIDCIESNMGGGWTIWLSAGVSYIELTLTRVSPKHLAVWAIKIDSLTTVEDLETVEAALLLARLIINRPEDMEVAR